MHVICAYGMAIVVAIGLWGLMFHAFGDVFTLSLMMALLVWCIIVGVTHKGLDE